MCVCVCVLFEATLSCWVKGKPKGKPPHILHQLDWGMNQYSWSSLVRVGFCPWYDRRFCQIIKQMANLAGACRTREIAHKNPATVPFICLLSQPPIQGMANFEAFHFFRIRTYSLYKTEGVLCVRKLGESYRRPPKWHCSLQEIG